MKLIILSILILSINLQQENIPVNIWENISNTSDIPQNNRIRPRGGSLASEMGQSLFNKLSNKNETKMQDQASQYSTSAKFAQKSFAKCRVRTGRKRTHWSWTSDHPFVSGSGSRSVWYWVKFTPNFPWGAKPKVEVSLNGLDINKDRNLRVTASVAWRNRQGFVLKITTWADTKVYFAEYTYNAHHGCE